MSKTIYEKLEINVCKVLCNSGHGTGFLISNELILTAFHVVNGCEEIKVTFDNKKELDVTLHELIDDEYKKLDIAILKLNKRIDFYEDIPILDTKIQHNAKWISRGFPSFNIESGENILEHISNVINGQNPLQNSNDIRLDFKQKLDTYQGFSGAPLIIDNSIVGIIKDEQLERGISKQLNALSTKYFKCLLEELQILSIIKKEHIEFLPYEEAKQKALMYKNKRGKLLKNKGDWMRYCISLKKDDGVPKDPDKIYKDKGWKDWKDWLSNDNTKLMNFEKAKVFVHSLGLKTQREWNSYCRGKRPSCKEKPSSIPSNPDARYWREWKSWSDWLVGGERYLSFKEAREYVRKLKLKGLPEWNKYTKGKLTEYEPLPHNIPVAPNTVYVGQYKNIADWLGYERKIKPSKGAKLEDNWWSYEEAKKFVHGLKLRNSTEWKKYIDGKFETLPKYPKESIPKSPAITYKNYNCWTGWPDFLGESYKSK